jgi:hypothetical protein
MKLDWADLFRLSKSLLLELFPNRVPIRKVILNRIFKQFELIRLDLFRLSKIFKQFEMDHTDNTVSWSCLVKWKS